MDAQAPLPKTDEPGQPSVTDTRAPALPVGPPEARRAVALPGERRLRPAPQQRRTLASRSARGVGSALVWAVKRVLPFDHPLLQQDAFRAYWLSRLLGQAAQGAVLYALLIVIVDRTDDPFYGSLFVACSIVPSLFLGLPGGLVVDAVPRRLLLVTLNLIRAGIVLLLLNPQPPLGLIFAVTLGIWTVHQFYNPAEGTTPASLVPAAAYADAQALANLALALAQLLGMVVAGPLLLRFASPSALFAFCGALFIGAAMLTAVLPPLRGYGAVERSEMREATAPRGYPAGGFRGLLFAGWRTIRADTPTMKAMSDDVLVGVGLSALVVIAPFYLVRVLNTSSENTVFVFAPAAFGLVVGLRLAPAIGRAIGLQPAVTVSLVVFALSVGGLGFVERIRSALNGVGMSVDRLSDVVGIPALVLIVMALSVPAGFASAVVGVSARAVLLARTPESARGQVVATQNVLGNLGALIPTLLAGVTADYFGVRAIAVAIALVILGGAVAVWAFTRGPTGAPAPG
jgi:hypothetical protein